MNKSTISQVMSAMGKLAKGHPKTLTDADRERRREAMRALNARRITLGKWQAMTVPERCLALDSGAISAETAAAFTVVLATAKPTL